MILTWILVLESFLAITVCQNPIGNIAASNEDRPSECAAPNCDCCVSQNCSTCNSNCINGRFGGKCRNKCPDRCVSCYDYGANNSVYQAHGYCTKCKTGYYSDPPDYFQCNYQCSAGCDSCQQATQCHSCIQGYYLEPTSSDYGKCTACPNSCAACTSLTDCSICKSGFEGIACENCTAGFYGVDCMNSCPNNCKDNICVKISGYCFNCKDGFTGVRCDICKAGWYSQNCDQECPLNCKALECGRYNGTCTKGCATNFNGSICDECIDGKHGIDCMKDCPKNCYSDICIRNTGYCSRCKTNFKGDTCEDCKDGWYSSDCSESCPTNCKDNVCKGEGGYCEECRDCSLSCPTKCKGNVCGRESGECIECNDGFYGSYCNNSCSSNCNGTSCNQNGVCDRGCKSGYSGDRCCVKGDNCLACSLNNNCSKCIDGKHGETCQKDCSASCVEGKCNKEDGNCAKPPEPDSDPLPLGTIVGGAAGGLVLIAIIVLLVFCFVKRRSANNTGKPYRNEVLSKNETIYENESSFADSFTAPKKNQPKSMTAARAAEIDEEVNPEQLRDCLMAENDATQAGDTYYNTATVLRRKIKVRDLEKYVAGKDANFFENEFQELPQGLVKPYTDARKPENMSKNRYNLIYPYDETRVNLNPPGSDFINACYIDGYMKRKEYIASLGPIMKATENFKTFWRMVWQEDTQKIVMVTNLMERGSMKCEQYWPDLGKKQSYGDITVTCTSEDSYAEYTMRSFNVSKGREERQLFHIHYTAWPDKGVPDDVTSLIEFRQKVKATKVGMNGHTIVHCSAGVGRTGTYIALDILTKEGEATQEIDIFGCVSNMRYQRTTMVQTSEQYEYLHHAVVHSLTFGCEAIRSDTFQQYVKNSTDAQMKARFEKLHHMREKLDKEEVDAIAINKKLKDLNRQGADIPGSRYRPRLFEGRTTDESDYINAIFVNSYKRKNRYIIAQTPLPKTVIDFLTLVIQEKVSCIVSMDQNGSEEKGKGTYLPADNQDLKLGKFTVTSSKLSSNQCYVLRKINVEFTTKSRSVTREVYHYQCNHWARSSVLPDSTTTFLQLIRDTEKRADDNPENGPVLVHCMNAAERSGLFCAVSILIQKMEVEHEVSVVNTLRQVKVRRSQAIPNKEQYKFCHDCVSTYLQTFEANIYSNFS